MNRFFSFINDDGRTPKLILVVLLICLVLYAQLYMGHLNSAHEDVEPKVTTEVSPLFEDFCQQFMLGRGP